MLAVGEANTRGLMRYSIVPRPPVGLCSARSQCRRASSSKAAEIPSAVFSPRQPFVRDLDLGGKLLRVQDSKTQAGRRALEVPHFLRRSLGRKSILNFQPV